MNLILLSKNARHYCRWLGTFPDLKKKIIMQINLISLFLLLALVHVYGKTHSQITLHEKDAPLEKILRSIERQSGYVFFYDDKDVKDIRVSVQVNAVPIETALNESLKGIFLTYKIDQNDVLIRKTDQRALNSELQDSRLRQLIITGKVTDSIGRPLSKVSITIKESKLKIVTDDNGRFSLSTPLSAMTLVFSFVGMKTQEIRITNSTLNLHVVMRMAALSIEGIVVTGYSTIRKESFTGSYTQVTKEQLLQVSSNNLISALQVFDPSLRIKQNNELGSNPNALPELYIRGQSGFPGVKDLDKGEAGNASQFALKNNPNLPVFIMDGFEVGLEKIFDMDINRIQEITILKDAAATAIYGSRASNGVIVIQTIAPKPGEFRISYRGDYGVTVPDLTSYNMMNAQEKLDAELAAGIFLPDKSISPSDYEASFIRGKWDYLQKRNQVNKGVDTYWLSQPLSTMFNNKHNLYIEGGSGDLRLGLEFRYDNQNGVMKDSYRDRMGAGLTLDYRFSGLQIRNQTYFDVVKANESPYGSFSDYSRLQPYYSIYNETNGALIEEYRNENTGNVDKNPLYESTLGNFSNNRYNEWTNNLSANMYLSPHLLIKAQFAVNYKNANTEKFISPTSTVYTNASTFSKGDLTLSENRNLNWNANLFTSYNRVIGFNHINFSIGLNAKAVKEDYGTSSYRGFPNADLHSPAYAYEVVKKPEFDDNKTRLLGSFAALNYSFNEIYLFDASFRLDGSSEFGTHRKWAPFWSVGTGINLHNTPLLQGLGKISVFRLKANIGQTGKSNFSPFMARNTYKVLLDDWYPTGIGANILYMGNQNLTWEKQISWNLGTDISIFNRYTFNFNYYYKTTYDLITDVSLPTSSGFTVYRDNIGKVLNKGFEVQTSLNVINSRNFNLIVNGNIAHNKNRILEIAESLKNYNKRVDDYYGAYQQSGEGSPEWLILVYNKGNMKYSAPIRKYQEGSSLTTIYGMKSLGVNPANGKEVYMKRDGSITYDWSSLEQQDIGNTEPWAQGSFGINARFKKFTLYTSFLYEWRGDAYNTTLVTNVENVNLSNYNADRRVLTDRWQKPGDVTPLKSIQDRYFVSRPTSRFIQENNFIAFNSLSIAYDFNAVKLKKYKINSLRISLLLNDLARFSTIQREMGLDYPYARTASLSLNATF